MNKEQIAQEIIRLETYLPYADGQQYYRDRDRIGELKRELYRLKLKEELTRIEHEGVLRKIER